MIVTPAVGNTAPPAGSQQRTIEIRSYDNFQRGIDALNSLQTQIEAKIKEGDAFIEALAAAAGKGTVTASSGATTVTPTPGGTTVPHIYQETVAAASTATDSATKLAAGVSASLKTTIQNLQTTLDGQRAIQREGADAANKA